MHLKFRIQKDYDTVKNVYKSKTPTINKLFIFKRRVVFLHIFITIFITQYSK